MATILIINADYYKDVSNALLRGAVTALDAAGYEHKIITVPGAFEIPGAIRLAMESGRYAGYVALGCVIRGETTHYDYVCGECARGMQDLATHYMAAIGFGVLTVENIEQAWERADINQGNKGAEAVIACLTMIELKQHFKRAE
jgi:6,7-dimethyl-8-ribityllumazine synthase